MDLIEIAHFEPKAYLYDNKTVVSIGFNPRGKKRGIKIEGKSHDVDENKGKRK